MAAPTIVQVYPNPGDVDVVLGTSINIYFDQPMDITTITPATFSLTGPGQSQVVSPDELNSRFPRPVAGREYIQGTFSFSSIAIPGPAEGNTVASFSPARPLRPNVIYTVLVVGSDLTSATGVVVQNLASPPVPLGSTNQWTFTTGALNVSVPPVTSPIAPLVLPLDPGNVKIQQKLWAVGNDLSQELDIIFPAPIDTSTVTPEQILLSLEPILNDPSVIVPGGLTAAVTITGNTIAVLVTGWPMS
jgi:hypothetical protein